MNKDKLRKDIKEAIKKYEGMPLDVKVVCDSYVEEVANVVVSQAFDSEDFEESIRIFRNEV